MSRSDAFPSPSPVNEKLGVRTEDLPDGTVRLTLSTDASFHNEVGFVHGGVPTFLLDGAMGRACGRTLDLERGESCATVQLSVQFLTKAVGTLVATGRVVRRGRRIAFLEGECLREDGTGVARAPGP
ncbi:MAG: PaaI family thioesterase, partial [Planctomycetota bacterium JB042]